MGHKRFGAGTVCFYVSVSALALIAIVLAAIAYHRTQNPSTTTLVGDPEPCPPSNISSAPVIVYLPAAKTPAPTPVRGAASLDVDTCGCPSYNEGDPTCATEHRWGVAKVWNNDTQAFEITVTTSADEVLAGTFQLILSNSGVPSTTLQSVYVGLEQSAPNVGNAPGPSGKNWQRVAQAIMNQADTCTDNNEAWLCSGSTAYHTSGSVGSTVSVWDEDGNSIAGLATVIIPTTSADCDGDGNVLDGGFDGPNCPYNGNLTLDDDNDGRFNEDGYCCNVTRLELRYRFDLEGAGTNLTALAGKSVRINVLSTFSSGVAQRGATCAADTNCNGAISITEQNTRTVQSRHSFVFPVACDEQCECTRFADFTTIRTTGLGIPPQIDLVPDFIRSTMLCTHNVTSLLFDFWINATIECPDPESNPALSGGILFNSANLVPDSDACIDSLGKPLIDPRFAFAGYSFTCPSTMATPSDASPVATPSPSSPPTPQPPPAGDICTYTGGIFAQTCQTEDLSGFDNLCVERRDAGVNPGCIVDLCVDLDADGLVQFGTQRTSGTYTSTYVNLSNTDPVALANMYRRFVIDNLGGGPSYHFTATLQFTSPLDNMATSARQLARQLAVAQFSAAMAFEDTNATLVSEFNDMVYSDDAACDGQVVPAARGHTFVDVLQFAECAISIDAPYTIASYWSSPSAIASACTQFCGFPTYSSQKATCIDFFSTYTYPSFASGGQTVWAALVDLLDLYNNEFDECRAASTGCLVLPVGA